MQFDSGNVTVNSNAAWTLIKNIVLQDGVFKAGLIALKTGGSPLTDFKITKAATPGGDHVDLVSGTDFATATLDIPSAIPKTINTLTANTGALIRMDGLLGTCEIGLYAKGLTTTLRASGTFV